MNDLHFEVHFAHTEADARLLEIAGLPVTYDIDVCEHCLRYIAGTAGGWTPYGVVLNSTSHRFICMTCALPLFSTDPSESNM